MTYKQYLQAHAERAINLTVDSTLHTFGGKEIRRFERGDVVDSDYSYEVGRWGDDETLIDDFFASDGIETITHIAWYLSQDGTADVARIMAHAATTPQLAVLMFSGSYEVDIANVLDAFPNLHTLWLPGAKHMRMSVTRHSNVQRMFLLGPMDDDVITNVSLPQLKSLGIGGNNLHQLLMAAADNGQLDQLYNLSLNFKQYQGDMSDISLPPVASLELLDGQNALHPALLDVVKRPMAKTLQRLAVFGERFADPTMLNSDNFPALRDLTLRFPTSNEGYSYVESLSRMTFAQGIHVDMRNASINNADVQTIYDAVHTANILSLNLEHNRIVGDDEVALLNSLDIPVNLSNQLALPAYDDDDDEFE